MSGYVRETSGGVPGMTIAPRRAEKQASGDMEPAIRMFTSESGTVRWVTRVAGAEGLEFSVSGPDHWRNSSVFGDPTALERFQAEYERFLRDNGFSVSLVNDRRWRADRRTSPRPEADRRRSV
jgi:hypothetical protein